MCHCHQMQSLSPSSNSFPIPPTEYHDPCLCPAHTDTDLPVLEALVRLQLCIWHHSLFPNVVHQHAIVECGILQHHEQVVFQQFDPNIDMDSWYYDKYMLICTYSLLTWEILHNICYKSQYSLLCWLHASANDVRGPVLMPSKAATTAMIKDLSWIQREGAIGCINPKNAVNICHLNVPFGVRGRHLFFHVTLITIGYYTVSLLHTCFKIKHRTLSQKWH